MKWKWKGILLLLTILWAANAPAASLEVTPLYDSRSIQPGILIPFRVGGESVNSGELSAFVKDSSGKDCRVMRDPYIPKVFLLKCADEADVQIVFRVTNKERVIELNFGPVPVRKYDSNLVVVAPGNDGGGDEKYVEGRRLFQVYCAGCHDAASKRGSSEAAIKQAIRGLLPGTGSMKNSTELQLLSDEDIAKIVRYLGNP